MPLMTSGVYIGSDDRGYEAETSYYLNFQIISAHWHHWQKSTHLMIVTDGKTPVSIITTIRIICCFQSGKLRIAFR